MQVGPKMTKRLGNLKHIFVVISDLDHIYRSHSYWRYACNFCTQILLSYCFEISATRQNMEVGLSSD